MSISESIKTKFFEEFNQLKSQAASVGESALFKLTSEFNKATGGRLSHYNSPLPVAVALVPTEKDGKLGYIACKRAIPPFVGGIAFPGGFVNEGETGKQAVIREFSEEVGIDLGYTGEWEFVGERITPNNHLLLFYKYSDIVGWAMATVCFDHLDDNSEIQSLVFLEEDTEMCFPMQKEIHVQELNKQKTVL